MKTYEPAKFRLAVAAEVLEFKIAVIRRHLRLAGHDDTLSEGEILNITRAKSESLNLIIKKILAGRSQSAAQSVLVSLRSRLGLIGRPW